MNELINSLELYLENMKKDMEEAVEKMLYQELPVLTEEKFAIFENTGNRTIYEKDYFGRRRFLACFGVAAMRMKQEGLKNLGNVSREELCHKLEEIIFDICREECWAVPAHVTRKNNTQWRYTIDLFASETGGAVAEITDVLQDWLSEECCETARENVKKRILDPFFCAPVNTYGWEQSDHNWNAVCNSNIAIAYMHWLQEGEEGKAEYIARICDNLSYFIDGYADDGTCMEGLGYFTYGMGYFTNFALELYETTDGYIDLLKGDWDKYKAGDKDKRAKIAAWWSQCFFRSGRTVSFSDGNNRGHFRAGLSCALAERFEDVKVPDFRLAEHFEKDSTARFIPYKMDYFCTKQYLEYLKKQQTENVDSKDHTAQVEREPAGEFIILDFAQWCIGRAQNGVGMACKGGHNDEPHNHNDVGSFLYVVGEDMLLTDLGAGEYTKEYFSEGRYNIFCNNSLSHNVPVVNGQGQKHGRNYTCTCFEAKDLDGNGVVRMDLEKAYEEGLLKQFTREICFDKRNGNLTVRDLFDDEGKDIPVTESLVTQYVPEIADGAVLLTGNSGSCRIEISVKTEENGQIDEKTAPVFKVVTKEHSNHHGEKEQVYLIQWDVAVKDRTECIITIKNNA